jgi:hypothetical protein
LGWVIWKGIKLENVLFILKVGASGKSRDLLTVGRIYGWFGKKKRKLVQEFLGEG